MLKELIKRYGYDKVNSLTKYPSIKTLHEISAKGILTGKRNVVFNKEDELTAYEKIDGINVRILIYHDEYIIGSREQLLYHNMDVLHDRSHDIVEKIKYLQKVIPCTRQFVVVYGELYGEGVGRNGHQYGTGTGFRVFDLADFTYHVYLLNEPIEDISLWRERTKDPEDNPLAYITLDRLDFHKFDKVPKLAIPSEILYGLTTSSSHEKILHFLKNEIPQRSAVCLSENAQGKPEGIIIRDANRSSIVKLRLEDYQRTCNQYLLKRSKNEQNP